MPALAADNGFCNEGRNQACAFFRIHIQTLKAFLVRHAKESEELGELDACRLLSESAADGFARTVILVLKGRRHVGWLTVSQTAELSGVSVRSFQRRLADEGESFAQLARQARIELAKDLLSNTDRSLTEIASELGYTEPQNFFRAFKRWTGQTAQQFRNQVD